MHSRIFIFVLGLAFVLSTGAVNTASACDGHAKDKKADTTTSTTPETQEKH